MRGASGGSDRSRGLRPAVMPSGSAIVLLGTLWHRGGANRSTAPRLALSTQYCEPWARQQENTRSDPAAVVTTFSERVQELIGYSIHPPFMGTRAVSIRSAACAPTRLTRSASGSRRQFRMNG